MELFTSEDFNSARTKQKLKGKCDYCGMTFLSEKRAWKDRVKQNSPHYCSLQCAGKAKTQQKTMSVTCLNCGVKFVKRLSELYPSGRNFCSCSCNATYHNTHKTHGYRRSKLEVWLEQQLVPLYPQLSFVFNNKEAINSELDIYIPSLKLAFELNGIFHYEPIYGPEKLAQIQNNDDRKAQACWERGIELCLIDVSSFGYFKPERAEKYLDIIASIINKRLAGSS